MNDEDVEHIYNGVLPSHKKEWNNAFPVTWMHLEIVTLSEVGHKEND